LKHYEFKRTCANLRADSLRLLPMVGIVFAAVALSACGNKAEKKPGQALASVNGQEITVLQLNDELSRVNPQVASQEAGRKQVLEALIDRQLLEAEATKEKLDRDPKVVQSIERAKATLLAQAYLQRRIGQPAKPQPSEVEAYFNQNPQFFAERKQFDLRQLVLPSSALNDDVKKVIDGAKSLDEVATWLTDHQVKFARAQLARTSTDLPPQLSTKLLSMKPGQLFIIREGERSMLMTVAEIKDMPLNLEMAKPQIEQYLQNRKNKEAADAELKRLRTAAKIEYLNAPAGGAAKPAEGTVKPADGDTTNGTEGAHDRGVAGLK
jgi:peptidyl-prolyl cis-trans isomerase C